VNVPAETETTGLTTVAAERGPRSSLLGARSGRGREHAPHGMAIPIALSILPGLALFAIFILIPVGVLVVTSFAQWSVLGLDFTGLSNFDRLIHDAVFWKAFRNTALYAAVGIFIQVPIGVAVGMILAQRIRGWRVFRAILFAPVVVSGAAYALIFANVYNASYGLLNWTLDLVGIGGRDWLFDVDTALPAVAGTFAFNVGFFMILVMTEVAAIPVDVLEAAEVDGAPRLQRQLRIVLPLLRHVIGTCVLLSLLSSLAFFDIVYILTSGGPNDATITLTVYAFQRYAADQWGYANAIGLVVVVTGFLVIIAMKRLFRIGEREL
jgi:raffinose/stachyose/melibiose transport system permease protein